MRGVRLGGCLLLAAGAVIGWAARGGPACEGPAASVVPARYLRGAGGDDEILPAVAAPGRASQMATALLRPSIQVNAKNGAGAGIILSSRAERPGGPWRTHALTAFHVVSPALRKDGERLPIETVVYRADGEIDERLQSELMVWDEKKDVALLRLRSSRAYEAARLAPRERLSEVTVFTPVIAVGCPLGHDPLPTSGEISTLRKVVQGERFWMMNAPTIFGNSGGGVFHRETLELVGMSAMICTVEGPPQQPVPHLGILLPLESIYDWLDAAGLRSLYEESRAGGPVERGKKDW